MKQQRPRWVAPLLIVLAVVAVAVALLFLFFPADRLRTELERQVSRATGYNVRIETLALRLQGFGLGLSAGRVTATAPDSGQVYEAPELRLRVKLLPLLRQRVDIEALEADGLILTIRPGTRRPDGQPRPPTREEPGAGAALLIPDLRVTDGRIVHHGTGGTTRLFGVLLTGSFRGAGGGGGLFSGTVHADSTSFAPRATPDKPLRLPSIDARFESTIRGTPMTVTTTVDGTLGPIPATGTIDSAEEPAGWRNTGTVTLAATDAATLLPLLPPEQAAGLARYALGGRLEEGRLTFTTTPGVDEMDYAFTGRLEGLTAELPDKGRVVDSGSAALDIRPDNLTLDGALRSGEARLDVRARVVDFAAPAWNATVELTGPAIEALRFAPPQPDLVVRAGRVEARIEGRGRLGQAGLPEANGTIRLSELALSHTAIAVPVERFDARVTLAGTRLDLADGYLKAGQSEGWFDGRIADWRKPELDVTVQARTIHLDELFPEKPAGAGAAGGAAPSPTPAPPVRGRITIERLVRESLVVTNVSSRFEVDAAGMRLTDLEGTSYGGQVRGDLALRPLGNAVLDYSGHLAVDDMRAEDLLAAWTPIRGIEGRLDTDLTLSGKNGPGIDAFSVLTLIGKGLVFEGQLVNIPALRKVSEALQFEAGTADRIPFKTLRHSVRIENGFAQLDTFRVSQVNADWTVGGRIGLDGRLDCPVTARLAPTLFKPGSDLAKVADLVAAPDGRVEIGLKLGGTLTNPTVSVDLDPLLARAREKGKEALEDEVRKRLEDLLRRRP